MDKNNEVMKTEILRAFQCSGITYTKEIPKDNLEVASQWTKAFVYNFDDEKYLKFLCASVITDLCEQFKKSKLKGAARLEIEKADQKINKEDVSNTYFIKFRAY